jgi:hypothetical protein
MARHTRRQAEPPIDLFDYQQDRPVARRRAKPSDAPICVTDNWPVAVPVSDQEARVIEAFFADVLDELFGPLP